MTQLRQARVKFIGAGNEAKADKAKATPDGPGKGKYPRAIVLVKDKRVTVPLKSISATQ